MLRGRREAQPRARRGRGTFGGGPGRCRPRPPRSPPAGAAAGAGSCPEREVLKAREEAEGRGHLRSPNFLPAFCSHFAPAELKGGVRGEGGRGWAAEDEGKRVKSCGEQRGSHGRSRLVRLLRLAHSSSCHQHHGEKEKLRRPGAGERPWHPSAHPDLPVEANQVRVASSGYLGYSCNRAVEGGRGWERGGGGRLV